MTDHCKQGNIDIGACLLEILSMPTEVRYKAAPSLQEAFHWLIKFHIQRSTLLAGGLEPSTGQCTLYSVNSIPTH